MNHFLRKSKFAKFVLIGLLGGTCLFTVAAIIYVRFHYAAVMPRSPQPETGRIYPVKAQFEAVVYVNKQELQWRDFVEDDLPPVCGVGGILMFLLGSYLGWFNKPPKSGSGKRGQADF